MKKPSRRGGPRPGSGRKPIAEDARTLTIIIPAAMFDWCKFLGDGNASAYVRRVIEESIHAHMGRVIQERVAEAERLRREEEAKAQERIAPEVQAWIDAGKEAK